MAHWLDANVALAAPLGRAGRRGPDPCAGSALAVTRGLLLDLLATGDRDGVEAALGVFADRYRGRWWEGQEETGSSDRAS